MVKKRILSSSGAEFLGSHLYERLLAEGTRTLTLFGFAFSICLPFAATAQQIWFAPPDNLPRGGKVKNIDFPHLFDESPAWNADVNVFLLSPLMGSSTSPATTLQRINTFMIQRHIALAVGISAAQIDSAVSVPGECGFGVEGMTRPNRNAISFHRLKILGIDVQYVAMDEPLTFAHYYDKRASCHYTIEDTARRVAASITEIRQYYPNVKVVDFEAPTITSAAQWNTDFPRWLAAYRQAVGTPLNAVVFDIDWRQPWLGWVRPSITITHQNGSRAGLIIDGSGPGASDADAIAARKVNSLAVEQAKLPLDIVEIANWTAHPSRNLPETDPLTLSYFLHWYKSHFDAGG